MAQLERTYFPAKMVESELEQLLIENDSNVKVYSEPWLNGREKGFRFSVWKSRTFDSISVYVAECRNSDQLTATVSKAYEWSQVAENEYKNGRKFFKPGAYRKCAEFVAETLLGAHSTIDN